MKQTAEQQRWYQSRFELLEKSLNGESSSDVHRLRRAAMSRFHELGFPTRKQEDWRFTNIEPIISREFTHAEEGQGSRVTKEDIRKFSFGSPNELVFVNGMFSEELSTIRAIPNGVLCGSLAWGMKNHRDVVARALGRHAQFSDDSFVALNTAFVKDGAFLVVPEGIIVDEAVHIIYVVTAPDDTMITPRNLVVVGAGGRLSVVESYVTLAETRYLTNVVTEVSLEKGAVVEHDKLQHESMRGFHIASIYAHQEEKSNFTSNSVALGGHIVRNDVRAVLDAGESECTLNGLSLATGTQLIDNHTTIDHAKPHCASHELYKSILAGKSHGVFNGKIYVRKDAQKTDAKQTNKTLLLSDEATIDTKPQLEIFADDVKCTHGATIGQLDPDQMFYLRSRGIGETNARDILTFAFAADVVSRIHVDALKEQLEGLVHSKLQRGRTEQ